MKTRTYFSVLLACSFFALTANSHAERYPLFDSQDTLEIVLEVPMRELLRLARKKPVLVGQLHYVVSGENEAAIDITITSRGKSRLEHCSFPPLSITLDALQTGSTVFAGQKKLKIVTHCRDAASYLRYLHQEYGVYKAYNVLSNHSFRVRMLDVTYRDSRKKRRDDTRPAFFIESIDEVARRLGMTAVQTKAIRPDQFNQAETNIYELFQYMIANTDWAIKKGPRTENCCHNGKVIANPGAGNDWIVVPCDFDQAGLINTSYALPADGLGISNVRQRLYRGRCQHNDQLNETIELFNDRRDEVEVEIAPQPLTDRARRSAQKFVAGFYTIINDPAKLQKKVIRVCRGG